ncbi:MAG TPA: AMP-binding protein, partial [Acidimicrobiales bacterium]|nr:AMP-binding protein [Acidimicrobiales bacterium]
TNSLEYIESMAGVSILGGVAVPMNYRARGPELSHLLADSGTRALFTESRYESLVAGAAPSGLPVLYLDGDYPARRDGADPVDTVADVDDEDVGIILYTSGTTSLPKGVMLTHGALTGYVMNRTECADGTERGRTLLSAPLHHIAAVSSLLSSLYGGRSVIVMPQFEAEGWIDAVERHRATHTFLVPTMLARVISVPGVGKRDLSSLELVTYGAAPMPPSVIRRAIDVFPPTVGFTGAYGQTETTSTVTVLDPDDHRMTGDGEAVERKQRRLASVGKAVGDVELRIVDEDGKELPHGEVGEVEIRTFRTMSGYWGANASATGKAVGEDGWLHTGDLGYLDEDGYLFLGGRAGDLIIRGGENISPEDVEAAMYEHPDVAEAGVVGVPDEEWGERVAVAVVPREGATLTVEAVLAFAAERLPGYKRPETVMILEALPRTSTGKLLRRELLPMFQEGS